MLAGLEVLEGELAFVADIIKCFQYGEPGCGFIKQRAKSLPRMVDATLGVFLEVNILDALTKNGSPVLWKLVFHDVPGIEMRLDIVTGKAINKVHYLHRGYEVPVGEDILHVHMDFKLFSSRQELADCFTCSLVTYIIGSRVIIFSTRTVK